MARANPKSSRLNSPRRAGTCAQAVVCAALTLPLLASSVAAAASSRGAATIGGPAPKPKATIGGPVVLRSGTVGGASHPAAKPGVFGPASAPATPPPKPNGGG